MSLMSAPCTPHFGPLRFRGVGLEGATRRRRGGTESVLPRPAAADSAAAVSGCALLPLTDRCGAASRSTLGRNSRPCRILRARKVPHRPERSPHRAAAARSDRGDKRKAVWGGEEIDAPGPCALAPVSAPEESSWRRDNTCRENALPRREFPTGEAGSRKDAPNRRAVGAHYAPGFCSPVLSREPKAAAENDCY